MLTQIVYKLLIKLFIIDRMLEKAVSQELTEKEIGFENSLDDDNKRQEWVPKKLNWTQILYDQHIFIDAELYRKWDRNLCFEGEQLLEKDIQRTRSNEEYFRKPSTKQLLKRITTFYCIQNRINYQQGLLEVVIPFALLHRKDF